MRQTVSKSSKCITNAPDRNDLDHTRGESRRMWQGAKNFDQLAKRIALKAEEIDQKLVTQMILGVHGDLLKMYKKRVHSIV